VRGKCNMMIKGVSCFLRPLKFSGLNWLDSPVSGYLAQNQSLSSQSILQVTAVR